jgi:asparagine synthase (glutamine-hydrolysing)
MCAIAGLYAFAPSAPPADRAELRTIRDHMSARGPDGHGEWFSNDGRVAFGHRRLAIIDLSEGGAANPCTAPTASSSSPSTAKSTTTANCAASLKRKATSSAANQTRRYCCTCTRPKARPCCKTCAACTPLPCGTRRKQALLLARDPFGIKPLYYTPTSTGKATSNGTLRFASQVKALLAGGHVDTAPEPAGHTGFFLWGSVPAPYTLYRGIRALPAGHYLWVSGQGATEPQPFCQITDILAHAAANPARGTQGDALDAIGAAVRRQHRRAPRGRRARGHVPVRRH